MVENCSFGLDPPGHCEAVKHLLNVQILIDCIVCVSEGGSRSDISLGRANSKEEPISHPSPMNYGGGGHLQDKSQLFDGSQVNSIVTPIYKNREKRIFEFEVRLDPPH